MIGSGRTFLAGGGLVVGRVVVAAARRRSCSRCCVGRDDQFVVLGCAGRAAALGLGLGLVVGRLAVSVEEEPEHGVGDCGVCWCCGLGSRGRIVWLL